MAIQRIEVIVKGEEENKRLALAGLLEQMEYQEIRNAIAHLSSRRIVSLAQCIHGVMYEFVKGERV